MKILHHRRSSQIDFLPDTGLRFLRYPYARRHFRRFRFHINSASVERVNQLVELWAHIVPKMADYQKRWQFKQSDQFTKDHVMELIIGWFVCRIVEGSHLHTS
ncbi:hypothetical protein TNCT_134011 [Trichonephila clavata]|uniref:Uncharacterized protein n=1 Tax=Trichonephila clavata TaxID=2740835 RepID=A0A8X6HTQ4_TRICU|nr:hypothetical protein TNCT_134011 [Trichonephila clavata]